MLSSRKKYLSPSIFLFSLHNQLKTLIWLLQPFWKFPHIRDSLLLRISCSLYKGGKQEAFSMHFVESPEDPTVDQESEDDLSASRTSLERQAPHRGNTTVHVCWHRNTSVSMVDFSIAVEVSGSKWFGLQLERAIFFRHHFLSSRCPLG